LFKHQEQSVDGIPVLYSDAETALGRIPNDQDGPCCDKNWVAGCDCGLKPTTAYVFRPENESNAFEQLDLNKLLAL